MKLVRCNRCGLEGDVTLEPSGVAVMDALAAMAGASKYSKWTSLVLSPLAGMRRVKKAAADLCEDCTEVLVEQFLKGARVEAITQPAAQTALPHDPMQDCLLVWDPRRGGFLCQHDDPEMYDALVQDAKAAGQGEPVEGAGMGRRICSNCGCASHKEFGPCSSTGCDCVVDVTGQKVRTVQEWGEVKRNEELVSCPILQEGCGGRLPAYALADHMDTVHGIKPEPQRCTEACSEQHTYTAGCLLDNLVKKMPPGQVMPIACGAECDMQAGRHTNERGKCINNGDTLRDQTAICPICKADGWARDLTGHMAEVHQFYPDYSNCQWVDKNGYNLDGRLISQQGEDLTEAYSEQEPAPVEGPPDYFLPKELRLSDTAACAHMYPGTPCDWNECRQKSEPPLYVKKTQGHVAADDPTLMDSRGDE